MYILSRLCSLSQLHIPIPLYADFQSIPIFPLQISTPLVSIILSSPYNQLYYTISRIV